MFTGYSLFEMTTYLVLAELALSLRVRSLSLLSAFYLIETAGYLAGCSLETASGSGGLDGGKEPARLNTGSAQGAHTPHRHAR